MEVELDVTRARLLERFRWTHGHADLAGVFADAVLLGQLGPALAAPFREDGVTAVVGPEARGFVVASLVAQSLGASLVLARKPGAVHPGAVEQEATTPDWRGRLTSFRISRAGVDGERVLIADDWVETGAQARTVAALVRRLGGSVVGVTALVDDAAPDVRADLRLVALVRSTDLPPSA